MEFRVGGKVADEPSGGVRFLLFSFEQIERMFQPSLCQNAGVIFVRSGHVCEGPDRLGAGRGGVAVDEPHEVVEKRGRDGVSHVFLSGNHIGDESNSFLEHRQVSLLISFDLLKFGNDDLLSCVEDPLRDNDGTERRRRCEVGDETPGGTHEVGRSTGLYERADAFEKLRRPFETRLHLFRRHVR